MCRLHVNTDPKHVLHITIQYILWYCISVYRTVYAEGAYSKSHSACGDNQLAPHVLLQWKNTTFLCNARYLSPIE